MAERTAKKGDGEKNGKEGIVGTFNFGNNEGGVKRARETQSTQMGVWFSSGKGLREGMAREYGAKGPKVKTGG